MLDYLTHAAVKTLHRFEPQEGYFLAFSSGKDSICCHHLLKLSGCKFESHYSCTTVDEPSVLPFIRKFYPDVIIDHPAHSMFQLIAMKGDLPLRHHRWCCDKLKEYSGNGRLVITGIRKTESFERSKRTMFELDPRKRFNNKAFLNIIINWTEYHVFDFIRLYKLIIPDFYAEDCRSARGGCVGCPLSGAKTQIKDFIKYPRYKIAYLKAINKAILKGKFNKFENAEDVMNWWVSDKSMKNYFEYKKQTSLDI